MRWFPVAGLGFFRGWVSGDLFLGARGDLGKRGVRWLMVAGLGGRRGTGFALQGPRISTNRWLQAPSPPRGEERDSAERTMGVGLMSSISIKKECGCRTYTPRGQGNGTPTKRTMGVGLTHSTSLEKKFRV